MGLFGKYIDGAKKAGKEYKDKAAEKASATKGYVPAPKFDLMTSIPKETEDNAALVKKTGKPEGIEVRLKLFGEVIEIPAEADLFNKYTDLFSALARQCAKAAAEKYALKVHDYRSFIEEFPEIYDEFLYPVIKCAMDILFAENVFSVSLPAFTAMHKEKYHRGIDGYTVMLSAGEQATESNRNGLSTMLVSTAVEQYKQRNAGGMFGDLQGQLADSIVSRHKARIGISSEQEQTLFDALDAAELMHCSAADYMLVSVTLLEILTQSGTEIEAPGEEESNRADAIFQNITTPGFPEDKIKGALLDVLRTNPYKEEYFTFMAKKFGKTDEIVAAAEYFGFADKI